MERELALSSVTHQTSWDSKYFPAFLVFCLLLSVYLLTYSGVPVSDDEHLFAAVAQNLALQGEFRADQLLGNQRVHGQYANVGPLHPLLASFLYRIFHRVDLLGGFQSLYFLAPLYTALTGALLYLYAVAKNYTPQVALFAALAFGLSTIAWPYAQTFYREPLAMLLFFASFVVFEFLLDGHFVGKKEWAAWGIAGLFFFGAVLSRIHILLTLPLFILRFIYVGNKQPKKGRAVSWRVVFYIVLGVLAVFLAANWVGLDTFSRLRGYYFTRLFGIALKGIPAFFSLDSLLNLLGILISPSKGFLLYSPILCFAFLAYKDGGAHPRGSRIIPYGALVVFLVAQLFVYQDEWWNISWSTRFLLLVVPLLLAAALPVLDEILASPRRVPKMLFKALFVIGVLIQLGGVLISDSVYLNRLYGEYHVADLGDTIWQFRWMPAVQHWGMALHGEGLNLNLAFLRNRYFFPTFTALLLLILGAVLVFLVVSLIKVVQGKPVSAFFSAKWRVGLMGVYLVVVLPLLMLIAFRFDPAYFPAWENLPQVSQYINQEWQAGDVIVVDGYQKPAWYSLMNYTPLNTSWYSLPEDPMHWPTALDALFIPPAPPAHTWLVLEDVNVAAMQSLVQSSYRMKCWEIAPTGLEANTYTILLCEQ